MNYNIALPSQPKVISEEGNKGVFEIESLYPGYGHTLGNSLRRIILSSLPGSAVTTVKIEGVPHEFSTVSNIKEDVISIILNLKKLRFKMFVDEPQTVTISVRGEKDVTAKDIKTGSQVEILNPEQHIATLTSKDAKFDAELTIEKGLGYVSRENLRKDKVEIGTIVMDAAFTPVRRVNYEVEDMRVGDNTDYNRLRFVIETDGAVTPREALEKSIQIMVSHLNAIIGFQAEEKDLESMKEEVAEKVSKGEVIGAGASEEDVMKIRLDDLQFSARTLHSLSEGGIRTIGGLVRKKEEDLLQVEGVGKKTIQEIRRALGNYGLSLK